MSMFSFNSSKKYERIYEANIKLAKEKENKVKEKINKAREILKDMEEKLYAGLGVQIVDFSRPKYRP